MDLIKEAAKFDIEITTQMQNSLEKYAVTAGTAVNTGAIEQSIDLLLAGKTDYEFRTTVVRQLHTEEDIGKIAARISGAKAFFLQNFVDSGNLIGEGFSAHDIETLIRMRTRAAHFVPTVALRGI